MSVLRKSQLSSGKTIATTGVIRKGQLSTDQSSSIGVSGRVVIGKNRLSDVRRERAVDVGVRDDRKRPPRIIIPPVLPPIERFTPPPPVDIIPIYDRPRIPIPPEEIPRGLPPTIPGGEFLSHVKPDWFSGTDAEWQKYLAERGTFIAPKPDIYRPIIGGEEEGWGGRLIGEIRPRTIMPVTGGGILRPISSDPVTPIGKKTVIRGDGVVRGLGVVGPPTVRGAEPVSAGAGFVSGLGETISSITSGENKTLLYVVIGAIALVGIMAMRKK